MEVYSTPHYPRGFLLSRSPVSPPESFIAGPILDNFWIHPWTQVDASVESCSFVIVIGVCVPADRSTDREASSLLLEQLLQSEHNLLNALDYFVGRYAIIFGHAESIKIVNDATAMRAVFYAREERIVSSHALLVEEAIGGRVERAHLPVHHGYPGNLTPFSRTKILTPNTYLDISHNTVRRFWPVKPVPNTDVNEAAEQVINYASQALIAATRNRELRIALTAGLDSRVAVAIAIHSGLPFETYTYGSKKDTAIDRFFAHDLSKMMGVHHTLMPHRNGNSELSQSLATAHYLPHHVNVVPDLMDWFSGSQSLAVTGNLLEIGRKFYSRLEDSGVPSPTDPKSMAFLHRSKMRRSIDRRIHNFGEASWKSIAEGAFMQYYMDTEYEGTLGNIDAYDLFYWEHRMGTWHGPAMNERDFYAEAFIPFNSRQIFEILLGIDPENRKKGTVFYRMIKATVPELLELPINPKKWPA